MGKLRKTVQREVTDIINTSIFTSDDFEIGFGNPDSNEYLITIKFSYEKKYRYFIDQELGRYVVTKTPGDVIEEETVKYNSFESAINNIPKWCTEIRNELKAEQPVYSEIDSLKKRFSDGFKSWSL